MIIRHKIRFLCFLIIYIVFLAVISLLWISVSPDVFTLKYELSGDHCDTFQVYYSNGYIWNETASLSIDYQDIENSSSFSFDIPYNMTDIRIDLGNLPGTVEIKNIRLSLLNEEIFLNSDELLFGTENSILSLSVVSDGFIITTNNDSYFSYNLNNEKEQFEDIIRSKNFILKSIAIVAGTFVIFLLYKFSDGAVSVIKSFIQNYRLIISLSIADFKSKYAGSQFGIIWAFVQPAVTAIIYIFVFQVIGRAAPIDNQYPYSLWLLPGLIPWFYFSESITSSTSSLSEYSYLVKKIMFNIEILPIVKIVSCFFVHVFLALFVLLVYVIAGVPLNLTMIQIIYYMICNTALAISIGYLTCSLLPFFKDVGQIVNLVLMIAMWACPIMWDLNIITDDLNIVRNAIQLNPMYYIVRGFRESYMGEAWFTDHLLHTAYFWSVILILFVINTKVFKNLRPHFSDVL